jgi:recombination protein RecR
LEILPRALVSLIEELQHLPGVGPKSAHRLAFHLLRQPAGSTDRLARALVDVRQGVRFCEVCSFLSETPVCPLCSDERRDDTLICVVEEPTDVVAIERTGEFRGRYHVLMGAISPIDGVGPGEIRAEELLGRLVEGSFEEVILATDVDVEGEATSSYLAQSIAERMPQVRVSRLARGLPMGGELEYADELTLSRALSGRRPV